MPDIDIDISDRYELLDKIEYRIASLKNNKKHNTGIYLTEIPNNPINNQATIDYINAEKRGYFKIDLLNVSLYKKIKNEEHLYKLMNTEPIWELLEYREIVDELFHVNGHHDILKKLKPKSIEELACTLAIIRPGKRYLLNESWEKIKTEVWKKSNNDQYYFKKSHSISYAMAVIVHLNLICEEVINLNIRSK